MAKKLLFSLMLSLVLICTLISCGEDDQESSDSSQSSTIINDTTDTETETNTDTDDTETQPQKNYAATTMEKWIEAFAFINEGNINVNYSFVASDAEGHIENEYGVIKHFNGMEYQSKTVEEIKNGVSNIDSQGEFYYDVINCSMGIGTTYSSVINEIKTRVISGDDCGFNSFSYDEEEKCYVKHEDTDSKSIIVKIYFENDILDKYEYKQTSLKNNKIKQSTFTFLPVESVSFPTDEAISFANSAISKLSSAKSVTCTNSYSETPDATTEEILAAVSTILSTLPLDNPSFYSIGESVYFQCDTDVEFLDTSFKCKTIILYINENGISSIMFPENAYMRLRFEY